ncbi:VOC family protein [Mucilaginibacter litoreus]|uniref:VOC family protein n=1 Tax=Mucilaginibacter litoreus TaxID=1048221 RepID=A0ABW3AY19_9SPHI
MPTVSFAPELVIPHGITDVSFYTHAFGAKEVRRFTNHDGSIHVVEFSIGGALFHLHEEWASDAVSPEKAGATTVIVGMFVEDVDTIVTQAETAGARVHSPPQDYDYGYRQAKVIDIFGHHWQIQQKI